MSGRGDSAIHTAAPYLKISPRSDGSIWGTEFFRRCGVLDGAGQVSSSEVQFRKLAVDAAATRIEAHGAGIRLDGLIRLSFGLVCGALLDADVRLEVLVVYRRGELFAVRQNLPQGLEGLVARMLGVVQPS